MKAKTLSSPAARAKGSNRLRTVLRRRPRDAPRRRAAGSPGARQARLFDQRLDRAGEGRGSRGRQAELPGDLELGAFSVSLSVADLARSRGFYEQLGFVAVGGDPEGDYLIMKNGETTIGLFQGVSGARAWRRHLSEHAHRPGADIEVLRDAAAKTRSAVTTKRQAAG